jgi:hypothetical protein
MFREKSEAITLMLAAFSLELALGDNQVGFSISRLF